MHTWWDKRIKGAYKEDGVAPRGAAISAERVVVGTAHRLTGVVLVDAGGPTMASPRSTWRAVERSAASRGGA